MILEMGCSIDFEGHKSTPMHCAAYYGHRKIITILLDWGISTRVKNFCENLPIEEAATDEIRSLLEASDKDKIAGLFAKIKGPNMKLIELK